MGFGSIGRCRPWSNLDVDFLREWLEEGHTPVYIAYQMRRDPNAVIAFCEEYGLNPRRPLKKYWVVFTTSQEPMRAFETWAQAEVWRREWGEVRGGESIILHMRDYSPHNLHFRSQLRRLIVERREARDICRSLSRKVGGPVDRDALKAMARRLDIRNRIGERVTPVGQ